MPENPQTEEFWTSFYRDNQTPWQLPTPCPPIFKHLDENPQKPGKLAVVGCGTGPEPIEFARRGFQVTAFDISEIAIERATQQANSAGFDVRFVHSDIFKLGEDHDAEFDYIFEQTCFCAIDPIMRDSYVATVARMLKPGGILMGVFFDVEVESPPPYGVTEEEIRNRFSKDFELKILKRTPHSIEQREGREWLFYFTKN